jgi:hypothetical protein
MCVPSRGRSGRTMLRASSSVPSMPFGMRMGKNGEISSFGTQIQWISPRTEKEQQNKHAFFPYMTSVVAVTMY